jgi:hypothetical protein
LIKGDWEVEEMESVRCYPKPMFDFAERREICIQAMKNTYDIGLYGNDPRVLDGSWRKLFEDDAEGPTKGKKGLPAAAVEDEEVSHVDTTGKRRARRICMIRNQRAQRQRVGVVTRNEILVRARSTPLSSGRRSRGRIIPDPVLLACSLVRSAVIVEPKTGRLGLELAKPRLTQSSSDGPRSCRYSIRMSFATT